MDEKVSCVNRQKFHFCLTKRASSVKLILLVMLRTAVAVYCGHKLQPCDRNTKFLLPSSHVAIHHYNLQFKVKSYGSKLRSYFTKRQHCNILFTAASI